MQKPNNLTNETPKNLLEGVGFKKVGNMKKVSLILSAAVLTAMMLLSCGNSSKELTIGSQVWMVENLNVDKFSNGDPIPHVKTDADWEKADKNKQPAWCYYDNDPSNGEKYGKLYNWYAVNDPRGLVPKGWHVPSDEEWTTLTDHMGGDDVAGTKMKSTSGWHDDGNGTNGSGFLGLPGGFRDVDGTFNLIGKHGFWWSSSESNTSSSWFRFLYYPAGMVGRDNLSKECGLSVRCIKD